MELKFCLICPILCVLIHCGTDSGGNDNLLTHYHIKLDLDPAAQYLSVDMELRLNPEEPLPDTLDFALHRQFENLQISGAGIKDFTFDREAPPVSVFMRDARPLKVILKPHTDREGPLYISFKYKGTITSWVKNSANIVSEDWVELGMYLPWFPSGFICGHFTYEIEATADPSYNFRSYGNYTKKGNTWFLTGTIPTFDIILVASKGLRTAQRASGKTRMVLHYESLHDTTAAKFTGDLAEVLRLYGDWFGESKEDQVYTVIQSPRDRGGSYARKNMLVLSGLSDAMYTNQPDGVIRNLAHETAHFWWHMADVSSWEDWLNESFAEYSALLAIRKIFGTATFKTWLDGKKEQSKHLPPIWGLPRNDPHAAGGSGIIYRVLYDKGPLLLHELAGRIGDDAFKRLCKKRVETNVATTQAFLDLLETDHGKETRDLFTQLLKTN